MSCDATVGHPSRRTTVDGAFAGAGMQAAGSTIELQVGGRAGVPDDAVAVVLNVTVTDPQAPGFSTANPCGTDRPNASNLNYPVGRTIPNAVIAKVGEGGAVRLHVKSATQVIADVNGYFLAGA